MKHSFKKRIPVQNENRYMALMVYTITNNFCNESSRNVCQIKLTSSISAYISINLIYLLLFFLNLKTVTKSWNHNIKVRSLLHACVYTTNAVNLNRQKLVLSLHAKSLLKYLSIYCSEEMFMGLFISTW